VTRTGPRVTTRKAMGHSVIWAAAHVRADLISLMPPKVYRDVAGVAVEAPKPPVLVKPAEYADGKKLTISEWMYSTQKALDTEGNVVGIIRKVDGFGLPAEIEPVDPMLVSFLIRGARIAEYRVAGELVKPEHIWHERQYTSAGIPIGLSPIAHAARSLATGLAAQDFAYQWFEKGGVPSAVLANSEKVLSPETIRKAKLKFAESVQMGEPFVTGKDWTFTPIAAKAAESEFIHQMQLTDLELCRFMGVPADIVDVVVSGGSNITYANLMQRNLQLLVLNLGGAVNRREEALSDLVVGGRYVKLNRNALLAMDAKTRAEVFKLRSDSLTITPDQVRAYEDEQPFTEEDYAQLERLGRTGARTPNQPQTAGS
jgi:HK97 family phage portal protein